MVYDLTEKLKFGEDPKIKIRDVELTVRSDAETVLKLLDIVSRKGELAAAQETAELLLNERDRKKLTGLHLKMDDYSKVVRSAARLAVGADPDEEEPAGE